MTTITDEFMQQMLAKTRNYSIVILKAGPNKNMDGVQKSFGNTDAEILNSALTGCYQLSVQSLMEAMYQVLEFLMLVSKK